MSFSEASMQEVEMRTRGDVTPTRLPTITKIVVYQLAQVPFRVKVKGHILAAYLGL